MKTAFAAGLRATALPIVLSAVLLAACQTPPTLKPMPEYPAAFGLATVHVPSFNGLEPGQTLFCPGAGGCKLAPPGHDLRRLLVEDPRRLFLACVVDAKIPCEPVAGPSGFNQCRVPPVGGDLDDLPREAVRKCVAFVRVP